MDHDSRGVRHGDRKALGKAVSEKLIPLKKLYGRCRDSKALKGGGFVLLGLLLGLQAHETSKRGGIREWFEFHLPRRTTWVGVLQAKGFREVVDPNLKQRAFRTLPVSYGEEGSLWLSTPPGCAALFLGGGDGVPVFYCLPQEKKPQDWEYGGKGWVALEKLEGLVLPRVNPLPRGRKVWGDPREIHY